MFDIVAAFILDEFFILSMFQGGPGLHDDGIVANCLLDPSAVHMNQVMYL